MTRSTPRADEFGEVFPESVGLQLVHNSNFSFKFYQSANYLFWVIRRTCPSFHRLVCGHISLRADLSWVLNEIGMLTTRLTELLSELNAKMDVIATS
jgi:hypothetical protein